MAQKSLGMFYKNIWLWLHYIPLALVGLGITNLTAHLFKIHEIHSLTFNIILFLMFYISFAVFDQIIHAILNLFGVKD